MRRIEVGRELSLTSGPFSGFDAVVKELLPEGVLVSVSMFGKTAEKILPEHELLGPAGLERALEDALSDVDAKLLRLAEAARASDIALNPPASAEALDRLEATLGTRLPATFRALYRTFDGYEKTGEFGDRTPLVNDLGALVSAEEIPDIWAMWNEIDAKTNAARYGEGALWNRAWIPFLEMESWGLGTIDARGCFDGTPGQVLEFDFKVAERSITFGSFDAWLASVLVQCEAWVLFAKRGDRAIAIEKRFAPGLPRHVVVEPAESS